MQGIVETPQYLSDVRAAKLTSEEAEAIILMLARDPKAGVLIPETGGARHVECF